MNHPVRIELETVSSPNCHLMTVEPGQLFQNFGKAEKGIIVLPFGKVAGMSAIGAQNQSTLEAL